MNRFAIPLIAAAMATPAVAAEVQIQSPGPVVELTVHESVEAAPDIATVSAGVTTQASTAVEAMRTNARAMTSVVERIKQLGVAERDIQTSGISLGAMYDYNQQTQRQVFRGYQASNRVSVKLRDIQRTGEVLDALVAAGATDLGGPAWSIDDDTSARRQARTAAVERAQAQALEYARLTGYTGLRLLEINETMVPSQPMPMMRQMARAEAADSSTPVQPGMVEAGVTVTVKYEMTR
ncbi:MAG TPA: SIMPL domain-containing protein [Kofleriaceae bacterium]|nr:SIMPL domain-containing protein [Kofleriaceae bacterium]